VGDTIVTLRYYSFDGENYSMKKYIAIVGITLLFGLGSNLLVAKSCDKSKAAVKSHGTCAKYCKKCYSAHKKKCNKKCKANIDK
jgi:hypothetical protein